MFFFHGCLDAFFLVFNTLFQISLLAIEWWSCLESHLLWMGLNEFIFENPIEYFDQYLTDVIEWTLMLVNWYKWSLCVRYIDKPQIINYNNWIKCIHIWMRIYQLLDTVAQRIKTNDKYPANVKINQIIFVQ